MSGQYIWKKLKSFTVSVFQWDIWRKFPQLKLLLPVSVRHGTFCFVLFCLFDSGSHYVVQGGLKLILQLRLSTNSWLMQTVSSLCAWMRSLVDLVWDLPLNLAYSTTCQYDFRWVTMITICTSLKEFCEGNKLHWGAFNDRTI